MGVFPNTSGSAPPRTLDLAALPELPPLRLEWEMSARCPTVDAHLRVSYGGEAEEFDVEYKPDWTQRSFLAAVERVRHAAKDRPMVALPYLDDDKLDALAAAGISGIDLCGNAVMVVPGRWLLRYTGRPNRFRIEQPLQNPYRGKASLVGRTLLRRPAFRRLNDLRREIRDDTAFAPLAAHLLDLLDALGPRGVPLVLVGGFGLFLVRPG